MWIYTPGETSMGPKYGKNHKPYIPKGLKEADMDMVWVEDSANLFGGYWKFYTKKKKKNEKNKIKKRK